MKRLLHVLAAACLGAVVISAAGRTLAQPDAGRLPPPEPEAFWGYISATNPYRAWHMWPGKTAFYPGTRPHGALLTTYVNGTALEGIDKAENQLPEGSIIVKENYSPLRQLESITAMYKVAGYDPRHNDWFWAKYSPQGQAQMAGKVKGCQDCHGRRAANDYIWTAQLRP